MLLCFGLANSCQYVDPMLKSIFDPANELFCGDGVVDNGEVCDDGSNTCGDGCESTCTGFHPGQVNPAQISTGGYYTCALDSSGVVCWGDHTFQIAIP